MMGGVRLRQLRLREAATGWEQNKCHTFDKR